MQHHGLTFVLWAHHLEGSAAAIFVTELRRVGLPVKVVGLHRQPVAGSFGLGLLPDLSLEEAVSLFPRVRCLILPGPLDRLAQLAQHPRLGELLDAVEGQGILVTAPPPHGAGESEAEGRPLFATVLTYPNAEGLLAFARELAGMLGGEG